VHAVSAPLSGGDSSVTAACQKRGSSVPTAKAEIVSKSFGLLKLAQVGNLIYIVQPPYRMHAQ
jgi:hypothetical protein